MSDASAQLAQMLAHQEWDRLRAALRVRRPDALALHGAKIYSQSDEDGMLAEIFRRIGPGRKRFLEVAVGDGLENNTLALLAAGWPGTWVEADAALAAQIRAGFPRLLASGRLRLEERRAGPSDMDRLAKEAGGGQELDLLSVDVDGNDFHLWRALQAHPRVVVIEYNARFPPPLEWTMPEDPGHQWAQTDYFGASLAALHRLGKAKGYTLVGCNLTGVNAFFVRDDLATKFPGPSGPEAHYEPARYWMVPHLSTGHPPDPRTVDSTA